MGATETQRECIRLEPRQLREFSGEFGQSFPIAVLRDWGLVEDGELVDDIEAVQKIYSDGRIVIDLPNDHRDPTNR